MSMRLGLKSFTVAPYGHEKKVNTPHAHSSSSSSQYTPENDGRGYHKDRRRHCRKYPLSCTISTHSSPSHFSCLSSPSWAAGLPSEASPASTTPAGARSSSTPEVFGSTRSRMASNYTSDVARPLWPMTTHNSELTAGRLVIAFVPTAGRKLEE